MTVGPAHPDRALPERVARAGAIAATLLVLLKLGAGLGTGSLGLLAEAAHSLADVGSALLALWAIRLANRPPDREHPFGHGNVEHLVALAESLGLIIVSSAIGALAVHRILTGTDGPHHAGIAIVVTCIVIAVDLWRFSAARAAARHGASAALSANAIHFGSDLLGSVAVLVGLGLVAAGEPRGDALAAIVVATLIIVAAVQLGWQNVQELMDRTPPEAEQAARRAIHGVSDQIELRRLRIRRSAHRFLLDVVVAAYGVEHVAQGHELADQVEDAVERALPGSDVVVHVEPTAAGEGLREQLLAAAQRVPGVHEIHNVRVVMVDGALEASMHLKFPAHWSLQAAHEIASRVERAAGAIPGIRSVTTHLEPLSSEIKRGERLDSEALQSSIRSITEQTVGSAPRDLAIHQTDDRTTALLTVGTAHSTSLQSAHQLATELEDAIRAEHPNIDEVVVHVEPDA